LDNATKLLDQAENTHKSQSTVNVTANAENARQIAEQVNADAINIYNNSIAKSQGAFWTTITFSTIGAIVFTFVLWVVWKQFKRRHMKKLLGMKPEVIENSN
jgi:hypothetical protein